MILSQLRALHPAATHKIEPVAKRDFPPAPSLDAEVVVSTLRSMNTFTKSGLDLLSVRQLCAVLDDSPDTLGETGLEALLYSRSVLSMVACLHPS